MAQYFQKDLTPHGRCMRFSWRNHEASDQVEQQQMGLT